MKFIKNYAEIHQNKLLKNIKTIYNTECAACLLSAHGRKRPTAICHALAWARGPAANRQAAEAACAPYPSWADFGPSKRRPPGAVDRSGSRSDGRPPISREQNHLRPVPPITLAHFSFLSPERAAAQPLAGALGGAADGRRARSCR
jgi:hypothetical protein